MIRVVVRYQDDDSIDKIKKHGNIIYQSRIMRVLGVETTETGYSKIKKIPGIISVEKSTKGKFLPITNACL